MVLGNYLIYVTAKLDYQLYQKQTQPMGGSYSRVYHICNSMIINRKHFPIPAGIAAAYSGSQLCKHGLVTALSLQMPDPNVFGNVMT